MKSLELAVALWIVRTGFYMCHPAVTDERLEVTVR